MLFGIMVLLAGLFTLAGNHFKWSFFWNNRKAVRLRRIIGDTATTIFYYVIGTIITVVGIAGIINPTLFN